MNDLLRGRISKVGPEIQWSSHTFKASHDAKNMLLYLRSDTDDYDGALISLSIAYILSHFLDLTSSTWLVRDCVTGQKQK